MKSKVTLIKLSIILFICSISVDIKSQDIPPEIVTISETDSNFIIDFNLPDYEIIDTNIYELYGINRDFTFINVESERFGIIWDIGYPCLPQLTINLSIPSGASDFKTSSSNITKETKTITYPILPSQEILLDSLYFAMNRDYYKSDGSLFAFNTILSKPYIIMEKDGISITILPFQYNPSQNKLEIIKHGTFTVSYNKQRFKSDKVLSYTKEQFVTKFFQNYKPSKLKSSSSPTYLIITAPRYENTLTFFANYKRNIGYDVTIVNTSTTGSSTGDIKDYIDNQNPAYVLLVGDIADIPTYGTTDGSDDWDPTTDLNYARIAGDDYFPDVFLGRLSVSTNQELQNVLNKTIFMETNLHNLGNNAKFLAGDEDNNWMARKFEEAHDVVIDDIFNPLGYNCEKIYAHSEGDDDNDALNALDDDPIFYIYSGHGSHFSLGDPFDISWGDINDPLRSHRTFPLGFSFACRTGNFGINECYGESWIRSQQGGISYFGCSVPSLVKPDVKLEKEILTPIGWLGPMIDIGKCQFWNLYKTIFNTRRWKRYMKSYNLLGDPTFYFSGIRCFDELVFLNNEIFHSGDSISYHSTNNIIAAENEATFVVESGANVELLAGEKIVLKPGFSAEAGSNFHAGIEPCNPTKSASLKSATIENNNQISTNNNNDSISLKDNSQINNVKIYPNPFSESFKIEYSLSKEGSVSIEIFNTLGNKIHNYTFKKIAGLHNYVYDGEKLVNGIYIVKIKTEEYQNIQILLKN